MIFIIFGLILVGVIAIMFAIKIIRGDYEKDN